MECQILDAFIFVCTMFEVAIFQYLGTYSRNATVS